MLLSYDDGAGAAAAQLSVLGSCRAADHNNFFFLYSSSRKQHLELFHPHHLQRRPHHYHRRNNLVVALARRPRPLRRLPLCPREDCGCLLPLLLYSLRLQVLQQLLLILFLAISSAAAGAAFPPPPPRPRSAANGGVCLCVRLSDLLLVQYCTILRPKYVAIPAIVVVTELDRCTSTYSPHQFRTSFFSTCPDCLHRVHRNALSTIALSMWHQITPTRCQTNHNCMLDCTVSLKYSSGDLRHGHVHAELAQLFVLQIEGFSPIFGAFQPHFLVLPR